jgi:ABC-type hemin transport system ATPase subunit
MAAFHQHQHYVHAPWQPDWLVYTGKSTLLKLMVGDLDPLDGMVKRHNHLKIGQYHQHLTELLPMDKTPLEYMVSAWRVWLLGSLCLGLGAWRVAFIRLGSHC